MELASAACAAVERLTTTSYSLAKRLASLLVRMEASALVPACCPNSGCDRPEMGMGPADVTLS